MNFANVAASSVQYGSASDIAGRGIASVLHADPVNARSPNGELAGRALDPVPN